MRKLFLALFFAVTIIGVTFANGQTEKQTSIDGTAVVTENANGTKSLAIQTKEGKLIQVAIGEADMARLQIRNNEQVRIKGVFLGETKENQVQTRIFARTMTMAGKTTKMQEPVQLTQQERDQVRAYESMQTQERTKNQTATGSGSGEDSGSGGSGGSGDSGSSGGGSSGSGESGGSGKSGK